MQYGFIAFRPLWSSPLPHIVRLLSSSFLLFTGHGCLPVAAPTPTIGLGVDCCVFVAFCMIQCVYAAQVADPSAHIQQPEVSEQYHSMLAAPAAQPYYLLFPPPPQLLDLLRIVGNTWKATSQPSSGFRRFDVR